jgi:hypothetical protein
MSLVSPLVGPLMAELTAAPGGDSLPYAPPPPPPPQPAVLAITQIGPQEAGGNVPVSYSIDKTDTGVAAVLFAAAEATPQAADFNGGGAPAYADLGTLTLDTSGTPLDLALPDGLDGSYRLALLPTDGGDAHVAVSAAVTIDTVVSAPDPMGADTGVIYWYGADDTTRSGTDVTAMNDKGGNAFALTSIGAFSAPQQADASSAIVFDGANPDVIQTATADAAQNLLVDHLTTGAGSVRMFMVIDADSLATTPAIFFAESANNGENQSFYFGALKNGSGNIQFWCRARRFSDAYDATPSTSVAASGAGLVLLELTITQSAWTAYLNGATVGTGAVTAGNLPNPSGTWVSLGARASGTIASAPATGGFHEVFVTGTTDGTVLSAIREQLAAKHSITI